MRGVPASDIIAAMRSHLCRLVLATATVCTAAACTTPAPEGAKKDAPVEVKPLVTPTVDAKATDTTDTAGPVGTPGTAGTVTAPGTAGDPTATASAGEATPTTGADTAGMAGTAGTPAATAGTAGTAGDPTAPAIDKPKLVGEIKNKKTSDARAKKALEEAEAGGFTVRELAEASNARGQALQNAGEGDRAKAAFEWARDKDPTYPDASFNLAKQTANAGEVPETVAHLKEVHRRGGKTLLKQVGYDPTFEIVKDDPEISKIVK